MRFKKKSCIIFIFLIFITIINVFGQEKYDVYFYGIVVPLSQENQKNITLDLFTAQIKVFPEVNLIDRRNSGFDTNYSKLSEQDAKSLTKESIFDLIPQEKNLQQGQKAILFLSKIDKTEDENWICSIYTKNLSTSKIDVIQKKFDSYYKILTDSRTLIADILAISTDQQIKSLSNKRTEQSNPVAQSPMTIEGLSGTWRGEKGITKIVIMRSGRGFVIFNNGASMNISISVDELEQNTKILKITQSAPFNASFYPDIPRQKILENSNNAKPIQWSFELTGTNSLTGFKETLVLDENGIVSQNTQTVKWEKIN